jgi:glycosyltransferase involved in cell wall biosynthesis
MQRLAVSVIIPTYNRATLVPRAVASALAAMSPADEVIVVDDGSTDGTEQVLSQFRSRIRYTRAQHGGAGPARNFGIDQARNPLVAFLDSDDEWMPDKLALQRALLERRPDVLFCFSDFGVRTRNGEERCYLQNWHQDPRPWDDILGPGVPFSTLAPLPMGRPDFPVHIGDLYLPYMERPYVMTITVVARREQAADALRFPDDLPTYEDWVCFARLARRGPAAYLDCETAWQHGHDGPRLTDANDYVRATSRLTILRRVWGADDTFLARHRGRYEHVVADQHLIRARALLAYGKTHEARAELDFAGGGPITYRLLASLPASLTRGLIRTRRVQSWAHGCLAALTRMIVECLT